jgi:hypothetical protein
MPPEEPPPEKPAPRTIVCREHGLRYDPLTSAGCVLCLRNAPAKPARKARWIVLAGAVAGIFLIVGLVAALWPQARAPAALPGPVAAIDAAVAAALDAPPDSPAEDACDVPFLDSDPEILVAETRHRCDAKDGKACTRLGFVCNETTWSRYPRGVLPSKQWPSQTCAELRTSTKIRQSCATVGNRGSWFNVACNAGDWLGCIQPSDPVELEANRRTDDERRKFAESACDRNEVAGCAELAMSVLTRSSGLRAAYARITDELVACRAGGRKACAPSPEARSALGTAKTAAERESADGTRQAGETETARMDALKHACDAKDASACFDLARASKDPSRSVAFTLRACQLGGLDACLSLQLMYMQGADGLPSYSRVLPAIRHGAELAHRASCSDAGDNAACFAAAKRLAAASYPSRPAPLAPDAAQNACQKGDASRCMEAARSYSAGSRSTPKDSAAAAEYRGKAMSLWNAECDRGVGASCLAVAQLLKGGSGAAHDSGGAVLYAQKGCNNAHDRPSCVVLAKMYEDGDGTAKDVGHGKRCMDAAMDFSRDAPVGCP